MSHEILSAQAIRSQFHNSLAFFSQISKPASKTLRKYIPPIRKKRVCCFAPHSLSSIVYSQGKTVAVTLKSSRNFLHFVQYFGLKRNRGYLFKKNLQFFFASCCLYPYGSVSAGREKCPFYVTFF